MQIGMHKLVEGTIIVGAAVVLALLWYLLGTKRPAPSAAPQAAAPLTHTTSRASSPSASSTASQPASAASGLDPIQGLYTNPF
ncbi:MAG: hypothetical protein KGI69_01255 [Patescibacteria group bacterium]|nr:hypothetical protein [Patescibacteria group bacterium]